MSITSILRDWGVGPSIVRITSKDNVATCQGANYILNQADNIALLNNGPFEFVIGDMVALAASNGNGVYEFDGDDFTTLKNLSGGGEGGSGVPYDFAQFDAGGSLADLGTSPTDSLLSKVVMYNPAVSTATDIIATYSDPDGSIKRPINGGTSLLPGSLRMGNPGGAYLRIYPPTLHTGAINILPIDNISGDFISTISNTSIGQASTYSLPDPAVPATNFIVSDGAGMGPPDCQVIRTGSFQVSNGNLYVGDNVADGSGFLQVFAPTAAHGSITLEAVDNALDFSSSIQNTATLGQNTIFTLPNPVAPGCTFAVCTTNFTAGYVVIGSGVEGLLDARPSTDFELASNIHAAVSADVGGGGAGPLTVTASGLTGSSIVSPVVKSSSNPVSVVAWAPGTNNFTVTLSGDPGVSCFISYIAIAAP